MSRYSAVNFTGSWFENGDREIAYSCCKNTHKSAAAADACARKDMAQNSATRRCFYPAIIKFADDSWKRLAEFSRKDKSEWE